MTIKPSRLPKIIVFVGDSHVVSFTESQYDKVLSSKLDRIGEQSYLFISLWFRDTLAFQIAKGEYPKNSLMIARVLGLLRTLGAKFVFCFGEIDVRCHLADPEKNADFLDRYTLNCAAMVRGRTDRVFFLMPTPPSDFYENHPSFPRFGNLAERVKAHKDFCSNLEASASAILSGYLAPRGELVDEQGGLRRELTTDGCHLNSKGAEIIRRCITKTFE